MRDYQKNGYILIRKRLKDDVLYYDKDNIQLYHGNCLSLLRDIPEESVNVIFADPPYFLSNGGSTCKNGKRASVNKGKWDEQESLSQMHEFNREWLSSCKKILHKDGTLWVSGTHHVIFSIGFLLQELGFKILNQITWEKPNPPPNLSCRYFTHSTETVLWAAKSKKSKYYFDYASMKAENNNKQMKDVWHFTAPRKAEKTHGKHPTQKPLALLERLLKASVKPGDIVLDPFNGSGTTGVAAKKMGISYKGIDQDQSYLDLTISRLEEIELFS